MQMLDMDQALAIIKELWFVWDQSSRQLILLNLYQLVWKYTYHA